MNRVGPVAILLLQCIAVSATASETVTKNGGVATSSRFATQAAVATLRDGGSAMDAAVAAAFVLTVARPDAAGIGGGGFLVYYDSREGATWSIDFREAAPWSLTSTEETPFEPDGITAVGTPAMVSGIHAAHERFGKLDWKPLLRPAILLAEEGFSPDLALITALTKAVEVGSLDAASRAVFLKDDASPIARRQLTQPELAATLTRIAKSPNELDSGTTATKIVEFMQQSGGLISIRDLRDYAPIWRAPLRIDLGTYSIETAPPPARGGIAIAAMLAILAPYDLASSDLDAPASSHLFVEAQRRATYDAKRVVADPTYSRIAIGSVLSAGRAEFWRSSILPDRATSTPTIIDRATSPSDHTAHISIVDREGNVASMTLSLRGRFGSGIMVPGTGVLLNAALRDFSSGSAAPHANEAEPRKRPSSPVAPLIMFRGDKPLLALGAGGGDAIAACLTSVILRLTKKNLSLTEAIGAPRLSQPDFPDRISYEPALAETAATLRAMGHNTTEQKEIGDVNAVMIDGDRIISVADPRGRGSAGGY